ncbi:NEDD4 family-interacting protein 1-like isoform X2 [Daktulosphaira vitifoliae]|uniref:NEDD4 family-interacting protein 1-like isoform X2 n=1 Tax=Daktulosphaira vitifoliae TaxID=58002 RepID=UPI0021AA46BD|nr:NEDD4 family-interacting protein 1-like isoform X2 [Daktulosphaira vitifoliae]
MNQEIDHHNTMNIPPPVYSNVVTVVQSNLPENSNVESSRQNTVNTIPMPHYDILPPRLDLSAPPPYEDCNPDLVKLPTYEEVQMEKQLEGEMSPRLPISPQTLTVLTIDAAQNTCEIDTNLLGTDYMFLTAFLVALIFNWVGFLALMCLCQTVAARYGALAGFGLSLAKWTMIVKRNTEMSDLSPENRTNTWLWWLVMAFGFLICIRAVIQYMNIKRGWRLLSVPAQERVLYFY